jgi:hypothetical protein
MRLNAAGVSYAEADQLFVQKVLAETERIEKRR